MFVAATLVLLISLRVYWESEPGLAAAALFWGAFMVGMPALLHRYHLLQTPMGVLLMAGFGLNALVTIANGGYMPIASHMQHPLYERLTDDTWLPWLADVYPLDTSLGDWLVGTAVLLFVGRFLRWRIARTVSPTT